MRWRWWKPLIVFGAVFGLLLLAGAHAGEWLIVQDELQKADAIVVFGGGLPFRSYEAARLYREGWAPQVWLPMPEPAAEWEAVKQFGLDPLDPQISQKLLVRLGVRSGDIRVLRPWVKNTREEVEAALEELRRQDGRRCILITSRQHTRRVGRIWNCLSRIYEQKVVRYTDYQNRFQPAGWWDREEDRRQVIHESLGLAETLFWPRLCFGS